MILPILAVITYGVWAAGTERVAGALLAFCVLFWVGVTALIVELYT